MTVEELIEVLKKAPKDAHVLYRAYSDLNPLEDGEVTVVTADEKRLVLRKGQYQGTHPTRAWGDEIPVYISAVIFPGN